MFLNLVPGQQTCLNYQFGKKVATYVDQNPSDLSIASIESLKFTSGLHFDTWSEYWQKCGESVMKLVEYLKDEGRHDLC